MDATLVAKLRAIPIFADLDDEALARVGAVVTEFEAPAGHVLTQPGQEGSGMFILEEGTVTVELPRGAIITLEPGEFFGELAILAAGRDADRPRSGGDGRPMPGGGAPRLRRDPGGGTRHRGRDAPGARPQDRGPREPRLSGWRRSTSGSSGRASTARRRRSTWRRADPSVVDLRTMDAGGRSDRSFERGVSRVLHEHVPGGRGARQHRDDGAVPRRSPASTPGSAAPACCSCIPRKTWTTCARRRSD